jgi:hypothetical protein
MDYPRCDAKETPASIEVWTPMIGGPSGRRMLPPLFWPPRSERGQTPSYLGYDLLLASRRRAVEARRPMIFLQLRTRRQGFCLIP